MDERNFARRFCELYAKLAPFHPGSGEGGVPARLDEKTPDGKLLIDVFSVLRAELRAAIIEQQSVRRY